MSQQSERQHRLLVKAAGLCCAVGYSLAAASCAMRAGMDHFQEGDFIDQLGEPLVVARLPLDDVWGAKRLALIVKLAVEDCAKTVGYIDPDHTALFFLAAEKQRPHTETERYHEAYLAIEEQCKARFHSASTIIPQGRAGIGDALLHAQKVLASNTVKQVLLVGADSYLNSATIESYLAQSRLLSSENSNGFIPGEAAGAVLLELANEQSSGLHISGVGRALEAAKPDGELPNRAIGLTHAMRQACEGAGIAPSELLFRLSDQNGEQYFAKEAANACTRLMSEESVFLPVMTIADCVGEVGAAAGAAMLAYLLTIMGRRDGPGHTGLMHLANDDGRRCAVILEQFA